MKQNSISGEPFYILSNFLSKRKQSVVLHGQNFSWINVQAGVLQDVGPLCFLTYINDLSCNLSSNANLFDDDTSLFSVVHNVNTSEKELNDDLKNLTIGLSNEEWVSTLI